MRYDILYVIGDSYTTPDFCVSVEDSYWSKFAKYINADIIVNHSHPGKNNSNMLRNAVRFVLENKEKNIFVLIGLTSLCRLDYYNRSIINLFNDKNGNTSELYIHNYDKKQSSEFDKWFVSTWCYEFSLVNLLKDILTSAAFFQLNKVDYLIQNCSATHQQELHNPLVKLFTQEVNKDLRVPNLYKDSFHNLNLELGIKPADYDNYGWHGHHGSEGNEIYFQYLKQKFEEISNRGLYASPNYGQYTI